MGIPNAAAFFLRHGVLLDVQTGGVDALVALNTKRKVIRLRGCCE